MRYSLFFVLVTLLAFGCGNPHLKSESLIRDTQGVTPGDGGDLVVTNADGNRELSIVTADPASNGTLELVNRGDLDYTFSAEFASGANFRWNGGSYPGVSGSCSQTQGPGTRCTFDIEFFAEAPGIYTDNLILTYAPTASPALTRRVLIPLRGERLADQLLGLDLTSAAGGSDLQIESRTPLARGFVNQHNPNADELITRYRFDNGAHFLLGSNGTCTGTQAGNDTCSVEIVFGANVEGRYSDTLIVTYALKARPQWTREVRLSLTGVRLPNSSTPPPTDCGDSRQVLQPNLSTVSHSGITFPYLDSVPDQSIRLGKLHGTQTNSRVLLLNRRTVRNAQVYVSYDVPAIDGEITDIFMNLDVSKVIRDDYPNSESLCLSTTGLKTCSGREFSVTSWKELRNHAFWTSYPGPVNTTYQDEFAKGLARCGRYLCFSMEKTFSAKELFELNTSQLSGLKGKPLHLIFSDDTRLKKIPTLTIVVKKPDGCRQE